MSKLVFAIEGLDRLGKSTLVDGLLNKLGYHQVIHFGKPKKLDAYRSAIRSPRDGMIIPEQSVQAFEYQRAGFLNSMLLARSGARIIFDRWHLGEAVYAPLYRGYSGDYVFDLETSTNLVNENCVRLILLVEDFKTSKHFVDDGESLGPVEKRQEEQERFLAAFSKSNLRDKRIITVTSTSGKFKTKEEILEEAV